MASIETVSIKDAAAELDVHPNTIRNYLAKNYLGYVKRPSGQRRVLREDLDRLRREMFAGPPAVVDDFDTEKLADDPDGTETIAYVEGPRP